MAFMCKRAHIFIENMAGVQIASRVCKLKLGGSVCELIPVMLSETGWSSAYEGYVAGYVFRSRESEDYGSDIDYLIGLYDFDADGIPELIIHNGYSGRALRCAYCYTYDGNEIVYAGICPSEAYYLKDSDYTGLLGRYSDSSEAYWSYYSKSGNIVSSESVYTETTYIDSAYIHRTTEDVYLFVACLNEEKIYFNQLYTIDDITIMGWDNFADTCLN